MTSGDVVASIIVVVLIAHMVWDMVPLPSWVDRLGFKIFRRRCMR